MPDAPSPLRGHLKAHSQGVIRLSLAAKERVAHRVGADAQFVFGGLHVERPQCTEMLPLILPAEIEVQFLHRGIGKGVHLVQGMHGAEIAEQELERRVIRGTQRLRRAGQEVPGHPSALYTPTREAVKPGFFSVTIRMPPTYRAIWV